MIATTTTKVLFFEQKLVHTCHKQKCVFICNTGLVLNLTRHAIVLTYNAKYIASGV